VIAPVRSSVGKTSTCMIAPVRSSVGKTNTCSPFTSFLKPFLLIQMTIALAYITHPKGNNLCNYFKHSYVNNEHFMSFYEEKNGREEDYTSVAFAVKNH
jgi:hypothetical protein